MKRDWKFYLSEYGVLIALLLLVIVNVATRGTSFLQPENLRNLISQNAEIGIIAIGMTFVIMTGGIDLSVGSMVAVCAALAMLTMNKVSQLGLPPNMAILVAVLIAIASGAFIGALNGLTIAYGRVAPFIVTLAGLAGFRSVALVLGKGGLIGSDVPAFRDFGFGGIPLPFVHDDRGNTIIFFWSAVAFLVVALLASFILNYTRLGRYIIAVGANEKAARYSAVNTKAIKVWTYAFLGALVGLAAVLNSARQNSVGTGSVGLYYELDAIAAVVIGGTSLRGGKGRIWGAVVGIVLLTLINNMMPALHIDTNWQGLVRGAVILIAVLLQRGSKEDV